MYAFLVRPHAQRPWLWTHVAVRKDQVPSQKGKRRVLRKQRGQHLHTNTHGQGFIQFLASASVGRLPNPSL